MRKWFALLLAMMLVVTACTPAGNTTEAPKATEPAATEAAATEAPATEAEATEAVATEPVEVGDIVKVGMGNSMSLMRSKEAEDDKGPSAGGNATVAVVGFDADGKIVDVKVDVVQPKVEYTQDGKIEGGPAAEFKTKVELGDEYGMKKASGIDKDWHEQMAAFEDWMIGKTVDEVLGLKVVEKDPSHPAVPDVPELTSSVTISVESYQAAVKEAWDNAVDATGVKAVGLGLNASAAKSKEIADDKMAAQFDIPMAGVGVDQDGKVVVAMLDNAQSRIAFDKDGKFVEAPGADVPTKMDLGADYGMVKASEIGKEWNEQAQAFAEWTVGKTADEISGLQVKERDESHKSVPDVPELTSSVTITVEDYQAVLVEAIANAQAE